MKKVKTIGLLAGLILFIPVVAFSNQAAETKVVDGVLISTVNSDSGAAMSNIYSSGTPDFIEAEVTLKQLSGPDVGTIFSGIGGWIYNDGASKSPIDMTGNVWAQVGLGLYDGNPVGAWGIIKSKNSSFSDYEILGVGFFDSVTPDATYAVSAAWDKAAETVTFTFDDQNHVYSVSESISSPVIPVWGIVTRVEAESGVIEAVFDNVIKDGVLFDDFSGDTLDSTKWFSLN